MENEFINRDLAILVVEEEIDGNQVQPCFLDPAISTPDLPIDRHERSKKTVPNCSMQPTAARTMPSKVLGKAARCVSHCKHRS